jgi:hypothetical protein
LAPPDVVKHSSVVTALGNSIDLMTLDSIGSNKHTIPEDPAIFCKPTSKYRLSGVGNSSTQLIENDNFLLELQPNLQAESRWPDVGLITYSKLAE